MKRSKKNRTIVGEKPTPQRFHQNGGLCRNDVKNLRGGATLRYRARWPSPLDLYRNKLIINRAQFEAGARFWQSYHRAVSGWAACRERARRITTTLEVPESLQRALDYVEQAYAVLSSDALGVVIDVCAYGQMAPSPEELALLREGLGHLAIEWGMAASEVCHRKKS